MGWKDKHPTPTEALQCPLFVANAHEQVLHRVEADIELKETMLRQAHDTVQTLQGEIAEVKHRDGLAQFDALISAAELQAVRDEASALPERFAIAEDEKESLRSEEEQALKVLSEVRADAQRLPQQEIHEFQASSVAEAEQLKKI